MSKGQPLNDWSEFYLPAPTCPPSDWALMGSRTVKGQTAGGKSKGVGGTHRVETLPLDNWELIGYTMASHCLLLVLEKATDKFDISSSRLALPLLGQLWAFTGDNHVQHIPGFTPLFWEIKVCIRKFYHMGRETLSFYTTSAWVKASGDSSGRESWEAFSDPIWLDVRSSSVHHFMGLHSTCWLAGAFPLSLSCVPPSYSTNTLVFHLLSCVLCLIPHISNTNIIVHVTRAGILGLCGTWPWQTQNQYATGCLIISCPSHHIAAYLASWAQPLGTSSLLSDLLCLNN